MKTTDANAREYIATLSIETLQRFAFDAFAALGKDDGEWLDNEEDFPSGADVCEALDGALSEAQITIEQIETWQKSPKDQRGPIGHGSLTIYNSKRDRAGNCAFAISFYHHPTGTTVNGTVDSGSGARQIPFYLNGGSYDPQPRGTPRPIAVTESEHGIREFNRMVKGWPHLGCTPKDIAAKIREAISTEGAR